MVRDQEGRNLLCFLEQLIRLEDCEYALLTPVDTPVSLFRLVESNYLELLTATTNNELILSMAAATLQKHNLTLVHSAVTLTVSGELEEPDVKEFEREGKDDEFETYELLVSFIVKGQEYGLCIPLSPFFVIARIENDCAILVGGEEYDGIQSRIEAKLEQWEQSN